MTLPTILTNHSKFSMIEGLSKYENMPQRYRRVIEYLGTQADQSESYRNRMPEGRCSPSWLLITVHLIVCNMATSACGITTVSILQRQTHVPSHTKILKLILHIAVNTSDS